jgi:hypothetical protein
MAALLVLPWSARAVPAEAPDRAPAAVSLEDGTVAAEPAEAEEILVAMAGQDEVETVDTAPLPKRVKGKVLGPDGSPVAGARVYFVATDITHPLLLSKIPSTALPVDLQEIMPWSGIRTFGHTRTDARGRFDMDMASPTPGRWTGDLEVRLPEAVSIRGHLLTPKGKPAAGALVTARGAFVRADETLLAVPRDMADENWPEYWPKPVRTNAEGVFTLTGMSSESYVALQLTHPDFATAEIYVNTRLGDESEPGTALEITTWDVVTRRAEDHLLASPLRHKQAAGDTEPGRFVQAQGRGIA